MRMFPMFYTTFNEIIEIIAEIAGFIYSAIYLVPSFLRGGKKID